MMVFSPRRSNRISPINDVIIPPIKIPNNTKSSDDAPLIQNNDVAVEPRSPSSTRSVPIFRTSSMQSLYNGYPKFTMFNLAPSADCSSCGNKK